MIIISHHLVLYFHFEHWLVIFFLQKKKWNPSLLEPTTDSRPWVPMMEYPLHTKTISAKFSWLALYSRTKKINAINEFFIFCCYFPGVTRSVVLHLKKMNPLHHIISKLAKGSAPWYVIPLRPRIFCANFGQNWLICSLKKDENMKCLQTDDRWSEKPIWFLAQYWAKTIFFEWFLVSTLFC